MVMPPFGRLGEPEAPASRSGLEPILGVVSSLTLLMSVPQAAKIWLERTAGGVSLISWAAYLVAACLWLIHGLRKRDKAIWVACLGWIALDIAVVAGILRYR